MKITQISLIFSIVAISSAIAASGQNAPVLDSDGDQVRVGQSYYLVSSITGAGISGYPPGCPYDIFLEESELEYGKIPLRFHPVDPNDDVVRDSTDLNIGFLPLPSENTCNESLVWTVPGFSFARVVTGGVIGNPGADTIRNWFKIEKTRLGYRLVYYPTVSDAIPPTTKGYLRINILFGMRFLVLNSYGWVFDFQIVKAEPTAGGRPFINMVTKA